MSCESIWDELGQIQEIYNNYNTNYPILIHVLEIYEKLNCLLGTI
jgi:hypothetical protein